MLGSLHAATQLTSGDAYYNDDDSEDARSIGENESDVESNENAGADVLQSEAPLQQQQQTISIAAPAPSNGLLVSNSSNSGNNAMSTFSSPLMKFKTFDLTCTATLHGIKSATEFAVFKPEFDIGKRLGGDNVRVVEMFVIGYDFKGVPVSLGIKVPAELSDVEHTHESASGPVFFVGKGLMEKEFSQPLVFFRGVENDFKQKQAIKFPGVDETNVHKAVTESPTPGMKLVKKGSIVASQIEDLIQDQMKADSNYRGPTMAAMEIKGLDSYNVDEKLANTAVNVLKGLFSATNNTLNVSTQLKFEAVRTKLSAETIEKMSSSTANAWTDPHEISMLLKGGASLDSITKSKFSGSITVGIKYIETPKAAKK